MTGGQQQGRHVGQGAPNGGAPVRVVVSVVLLVAWAAFIFYMSASNGDTSQGYSDGVAEVVAPYVVPGYDELPPAQQALTLDALSTPVRKFAHGFEYAVLGILACNLIWQLRRGHLAQATARLPWAPRWGALAWACCVAYAATDEFHQLFSDGRSAQVFDVGVDACGALVGVLLASAVLTSLQRRMR